MKLFIRHCRKFATYCWYEISLEGFLKSELSQQIIHLFSLLILVPIIIIGGFGIVFMLVGTVSQLLYIAYSSDKRLSADFTFTNIVQTGMNVVIVLGIGFLVTIILIDIAKPVRKFVSKAWRETSTKGVAKKLLE
jgi:hypothetical protein